MAAGITAPPYSIPPTSMSRQIKTYCGNSLDILKTFEANSFDSVVTDPPYGLSFMGKKWDYDVPSVEIWAECLRVLKPGGHLLAFAGTRTQHRMCVRIEDAGFEIRDMIAWVYGSGFPKGQNIGKTVDALLGNSREVISGEPKPKEFSGKCDQRDSNDREKSVGNSEYEGWGTSLKPALEPITMARKPLSESTIAKNVLAWGTGGINIDGCRVGAADTRALSSLSSFGRRTNNGGDAKEVWAGSASGRFPANLIHDGSEEVLKRFPNGPPSSAAIRKKAGHNRNKNTYNSQIQKIEKVEGHNDQGGSTSRFFYCAKASKADRDEGCEGMQAQRGLVGNKWTDQDYRRGDEAPSVERTNHHPTVKPNDLMRYLCRLVTPTGGIILDPFMGSGSTGKAAILEGFDFVGVDLNQEYVTIAEARINEAIKKPTLFD